jgi:hypothetical protein
MGQTEDAIVYQKTGAWREILDDILEMKELLLEKYDGVSKFLYEGKTRSLAGAGLDFTVGTMIALATKRTLRS